MIAEDLPAALNAFEPNRPLSTEAELAKFFVARPSSPLKRLRLMLESAQDTQKILFTGHRGCGKSTELAKLSLGLRERFFIFKYSVRDRLNMYDITYVDVLLALGLEMFNEAIVQKLPLSDKLYQQMLLFTKEISTTVVTGNPFGGEVTAELNLLVTKLNAKLKIEDKTRKEIRETVSPRLSSLLEMIDLLARSIEAETGKKVLAIVEDLDKVDSGPVKQLFYDHATSLSEPRVSIIYTFPIALRHDNDFAQVKMNFPTVQVLPIFKIRTKSGEIDAEATELCGEILARRVRRELFDNNAIGELSALCGGVPRNLISLGKQACLESMVDEKATIDSASVRAAALSSRRDYEVLLSHEQLSLLRKVHRTKEVDNDEPHRELLHNLSALEYWNDDVWYDVHPTVEPLLKI